MTKSIINISAFNTSVRNVSNTKQYKWHTHENNMFTYFGFVVSWILQTDSFPAFLVSTRIWLWRKTITVSSHMYVLLDVSFYLCYLCRLIKPVITAKTLFHVTFGFPFWRHLKGLHFDWRCLSETGVLQHILHGGGGRDFRALNKVTFLCLNLKSQRRCQCVAFYCFT